MAREEATDPARDAAEAATEKEIDALYGLPLEGFTKARNELAGELRSRGDRETAEQVRALAKPTVAAWAVNQVMRTQRKDARGLLAAGERLRKAHEDVAAGVAGARDLREAVDAERVAVERLSRAADGLMNTSGRGLSENVLERVRQTLHAISSDSEARSLASAGRLSRERQATGTEAFVAAPPKRRARDAKTRRPSKAQVQKARERLQRAQREARDLRSARTRAAHATSKAEQALTRAREGLRSADRKVAEKENEVEELRRKLEQLR
jgi:DNA repair exonuclease SbcCD ATPase subunit